MSKISLNQSEEWQLVDEHQDARGRDVLDNHGKIIGRVEDMLLDTDSQQVYALKLDGGMEVMASEVRFARDGLVYIKDEPVPTVRRIADQEQPPSTAMMTSAEEPPPPASTEPVRPPVPRPPEASPPPPEA